MVIWLSFTYPSISQEAPQKRGEIEIPVIVTPRDGLRLKSGSTIAMTNFLGACSEEVSDAMTQRLVDHHAYNVVTREHVARVIKEHRLNWDGYVDSTTASKLGRLLGADALVFGKIYYCSESGVQETEPETRHQRDTQALGVPVGTDGDSRRGARGGNKPPGVRVKEGVNLFANLFRAFAPRKWQASAGKYVDEASRIGEGIQDDGSFDISGLFQPSSVSSNGNGHGKKKIIIEGFVFVVGLEKGKILTASSHSGIYYFNDALSGKAPPLQQLGASSRGRINESLAQDYINLTNRILDRQDRDYTRLNKLALTRAAANFADNFATRIFLRPEFFDLNMYRDMGADIGLDNGIRYVYLGNCERAEMHFRAMAHRHFHEMGDGDVGRMLHNHGIALLCNNKPLDAILKLRAAWRILRSRSSEEAIRTGYIMLERNLEAKVETDTIIQMLIERIMGERVGKVHFPVTAGAE